MPGISPDNYHNNPWRPGAGEDKEINEAYTPYSRTLGFGWVQLGQAAAGAARAITERRAASGPFNDVRSAINAET
jgi:hypothetical protein